MSTTQQALKPASQLGTSNRSISLLEALALALFYCVTFTVIASVLHLQHGFPLDDSYIHQIVARNLVQYGTLGFTPGHSSSGTTSLLWTLVQATRYRLLPGMDPVWYNLALSYFFFAPIGPCLLLLARRDGLPSRIGWCLALAPALCGNLLWLGMIGMEHVLFLTLTLLALIAWLPGREGTGVSAALAGLFAGLLTLCRPEAILFGPLLFVVARLLLPATRKRGQQAIAWILWALACCIMLVTNLKTSSSLLPATLKGREWLYFHQIGGAHTSDAVAHFVGGWIQRLPRVFSTHFVRQLKTLSELASPSALLGEFIAAIALIGAVYLVRSRAPRLRLLLLWAAIHFLTYLVTFPEAGHGGRYQPLCLLLLAPLLCLGLYRLAALLLPQREDLAFGLASVLVGLALLSSLRTWRKVTLVGIAHINATHGRMAQWMNTHIPPDTRFAAFDIGRISYDWKGQVIDLGGLVDPSYMHFLNEGHVPDYLKLRQVQYVMLPGTGLAELGFGEDIKAEEVVRFCSPYNDWLLGFRYTIHATQCQVLYKL